MEQPTSSNPHHTATDTLRSHFMEVDNYAFEVLAVHDLCDLTSGVARNIVVVLERLWKRCDKAVETQAANEEQGFIKKLQHRQGHKAWKSEAAILTDLERNVMQLEVPWKAFSEINRLYQSYGVRAATLAILDPNFRIEYNRRLEKLGIHYAVPGEASSSASLEHLRHHPRSTLSLLTRDLSLRQQKQYKMQKPGGISEGLMEMMARMDVRE